MDLVRTRKPAAHLYTTATKESHCDPTMWPALPPMPAKMATPHELKTKNKEGLAYELLFEHGDANHQNSEVRPKRSQQCCHQSAVHPPVAGALLPCPHTPPILSIPCSSAALYSSPFSISVIICPNVHLMMQDRFKTVTSLTIMSRPDMAKVVDETAHVLLKNKSRKLLQDINQSYYKTTEQRYANAHLLFDPSNQEPTTALLRTAEIPNFHRRSLLAKGK